MLLEALFYSWTIGVFDHEEKIKYYRLNKGPHSENGYPLDYRGFERLQGYHREDYMPCPKCIKLHEPPPNCMCGGYGDIPKPREIES